MNLQLQSNLDESLRKGIVSSSERPGTIVVGAHVDFVEPVKGVVDDWSGTALLPSLYTALKQEPRHHSFQFVAFASRRAGYLAQYVKATSKEDLARIQDFAAVKQQDYYASYKLLAFYLAYLDQVLSPSAK